MNTFSSPSFVHSDPEVTVQEGQTAFFKCVVGSIRNNETISWVRRSDARLLFVGKTRIVGDGRFDLITKDNEHSVERTLRIRHVDANDTGNFECQLSTSPKLSKLFRLKVVGEKESIAISISLPDLL